MKKTVLTILICVMFCSTVSASEITEVQANLFSIESIERNLPPAAEKILKNQSPSHPIDLHDFMEELVQNIINQSKSLLHDGVLQIIQIIGIVMICCFMDCMDDMHLKSVGSYAGALGISAACISGVNSVIKLGVSTIEELSVFSSTLLPVTAAAAAAGGAVTGAATLYSLSVLFSNLFVRLINNFLIPFLYAFLILALLNSILQDHRLQSIFRFFGWMIKVSLKTIMYLFTGFLSITGILSGSTDAVKLKAAKLTMSGMIPVVGGIMSDVADTVLSGANLLRHTIGSFGMLAILAIFSLPFLRIAVQLLVFRGTSALSGLMGSELQKLLDAISEAMEYLLAMTSSCLMMCVFSCFALMKVGNLS